MPQYPSRMPALAKLKPAKPKPKNSVKVLAIVSPPRVKSTFTPFSRMRLLASMLIEPELRMLVAPTMNDEVPDKLPRKKLKKVKAKPPEQLMMPPLAPAARL